MFRQTTQKAAVLFSVCLTLSTFSLPTLADPYLRDASTRKSILKSTAIGAGVGAATGLFSDRSNLGRGVATGAVTGLGTGLISRSHYLNDKPLLRNSLEGAAIGTGASVATHRSAGKGALVGAGAGAGYHFLRQYLEKP